MDTMYRKKNREAQEALSETKKEKTENHLADDYNPKIRPRETHPDAISAEKRISKNLNKLNRELVETPAGEAVAVSEDRGAKVVTRSVSVKARAPLAIICSCAIIAAVFMYMISLNIQMDERSRSIDQLKEEIAELKEETTNLEIQMESKYDLDEVERIATQQYGMVAASSLPKKYVSVSQYMKEDVAEEEEKSPLASFWDSITSLFQKDGE